ncbi:MAG: hypothetical protein IK118_01490, partial [Clostridia bacterium]|nr:hypothetical protein [Clostridia bacterium]
EIHLPETASFVVGSLTVDGKPHVYTCENGTVTVNTGKDAAVVRLYVVMTEAGDTAFDASLVCDVDNNAVTQPIGSVSVRAENASISAVSVTPQTSVTVNGKTIANSTVELYDNGVFVGRTTANKVGSWSSELDLVDPVDLSDHIISAKVTTPDGVEFRTAEKTITYDVDAFMVKRVTMINSAQDNVTGQLVEYLTVFDFDKPDHSRHAYNYWPKYPKFTFVVEADGVPENVYSLSVVTYSAAGDRTEVPCYYDDETQTWIGFANYTSGASKPAAVSVSYSAVNAPEGSSVFPNDETLEYQPVAPGFGGVSAYSPISPAVGGAGVVTVCILPSDIAPNASFLLTNDNATIPASRVYRQSSGQVFASFDLSDAPSGQYSLEISGADVRRYDDCFTVDRSLPRGKLKYTMGAGVITATNVGYTDVASPIVAVRGGYYKNAFNNSYNVYKDRLIYLKNGNAEDILNLNVDIVDSGQISVNLQFGGEYLFLQNKEGLAGTIAHGQTAGAEFEYTCIPLPSPKNSNDKKTRAYNQFINQLNNNMSRTPFAYQVLNSHETNLFNALSNASVESYTELELRRSALNLLGMTDKTFSLSAAAMANELTADMETITLENIINAFYLAASGAIGVSATEDTEDLVAGSFSLTRRYSNSLLTETTRLDAGIFGFGWNSNCDARIGPVQTNGNTVLCLALYSDGKTQEFTRGSALTSVFTSTSGNGATAAIKSDGYLVTYASGRSMRFDTDGRLTKMTDENGNDLILTYSDDKVVSVTAEATGESVSYSYSGFYLTSVTTKYGTTNYFYNNDNLLNASQAANFNSLSRIEYPDGSFVEYSYDACGRVSQMKKNEHVQNYAYDLLTVSETDNMGAVNKTSYNSKGRIVRTESASGAVKTYSYDRNGYLASIGNGSGISEIYSYDNDGNLLSYRLSDGSVVSYEYDERGHLTGVTDAAGVETKYERDDAGKPTKIVYADGSSETATYNAKGNLVSSVSRTGVTQSYAYDERGNLVSVQYSTGETILYSYDDAGNRTVIDENGERTLLSYDENNALVSISYPDGNQISYTYDALGRRTCVTDADGYTTGYSYDAYGRLSAVTDGADALISYSYYPDGSVQRMTKANGTYTDYSYDGGILSAIVNRGPSGKTISSVRYTYDENGNISSMTDGNDLWRYGYDAQGQLSYAIEPNGNMTAYQYDAAGNRVSVTTNRSVTEYTSNPLNQYTQIGDVTLEYDAEGNLIRETSAAGEASYEWDYRGRLTKYTAADGDVYEYGYDAFDLRNSVSVNGSVTSYLNDPNGYGLALSSTGDAGTTHYLIADRIVGMEQNGVNYYYNANHLGSVTEITGSDGAVVNRYTYNQEGAVVSAVEGVANLYTYGGVFGLVSDRNGLLYDRARYVSERSDSFISKDLSGQLFDLNYYRYSVNDPLNKIDLTGHCPDAVILLGGLAMFGFLYSALRQMKAYGWSGINWLKAFNAGIGSAFIGVCVLLAWESAMGDIITLCSAGSPLIFRLGAIKELLLSALDGDLNLLYEAFLRGYELYWEDYDLPPIPADGKNDPSGYVYAGVVSNRVAGVTATIYYQGYPLDQFGEPDYDAGLQTIEWTEAEEYDELNPQLTDGAGQYRWDVLDGKWRIKYEKEGYAESWSDWMDVPPEYTDVNINLQTLTAPTVSSVVVYADGARLEFSQYMEISTVNASNAVLTAGGGTVSGIWTPVNAEENFEKTAQYASVFEFVPETQIGGDVTVTVRNVRNYAGIALEAPFTAEASVEIKPESVSAPQELFLSLHGSADVEIRVLPADAGGNKTLSVSCDTPSVLELGASTVQTDADGKAILTVTGSLPGEGIITLTLDGTDLSAQVSINVIGIVCAHETLEDVPGTPADCLSPGCTDGVRCVACGEWITTPEEIPATGHDFGAWTQLDAAYHQRVCANDASHTEKEEHAWDEGKITKAATTTAEGVKTYTCAVCGATRTETTPKALLKHTVTAVNTENGIELTWDKDENADGYIVYRKTTGSYTTLKKITSNETLSFENTTAKPGTKYTYAVRSYRGTENGTLATKAITRLTAITPTLSNVTDGISVKWTKVEGAAGYYIYRKAGTGSYSLVKKITSGDTVSYIDTAVKTKNGTVYTYYVRAYLSTTKGAYTEKKMTRLGAITPTLANASTGITVKWTKVTGASGYYIYRKAGSGSYTLVKKLTSASTVSYSDTAVKTESGTVYTYYVRAYKGTTKGAISAKAITRLGTITPTLANASTGITVKWTKIAGATGYYVYRKAGSGSYSLVKKITSGATVSLTDTDTKNGTSYTYYVRAFKSSTMGAYTVKKIVRLTGVKLTGLSNASSKAMTATWEKNTKATGYQLQYAANSSFTSAKTVTVKDAATVPQVIKSLTKGSTYYVRVRVYKTVSDVNYYSAWSAAKSVKIVK